MEKKTRPYTKKAVSEHHAKAVIAFRDALKAERAMMHQARRMEAAIRRENSLFLGKAVLCKRAWDEAAHACHAASTSIDTSALSPTASVPPESPLAEPDLAGVAPEFDSVPETDDLSETATSASRVGLILGEQTSAAPVVSESQVGVAPVITAAPVIAAAPALAGA